VVGLERGPLSLVRITEELLEWKSSGSGNIKSRLTAVGIRCADHVTLALLAKVGTKFVERRSLGLYSALADKSHGDSFLLACSMNLEKVKSLYDIYPNKSETKITNCFFTVTLPTISSHPTCSNRRNTNPTETAVHTAETKPYAMNAYRKRGILNICNIWR
jgi:hypothetical protein